MSTRDDSHLQVLLTAYADGSLHDEGCAFIERQLEEHPELRDRLGEIRAMQHLLRSSLPAIPGKLDDERRAVVMAAAERRPQRSRRWIAYLTAACLALVVSGMTLGVSGLRSRSRVESLNGGDTFGTCAAVPPMRITTMPAAAPAWPGSASGGSAFSPAAEANGNANAVSAIASLDLPVETNSNENDNPVPKGREEAVADSELGGQGAFLHIGQSNITAGRRTTPTSPQVATKEKHRPAESANGLQRDRLSDETKTAAPASSVPVTKPVRPAKPAIARQGPGRAPGGELLERSQADKKDAVEREQPEAKSLDLARRQKDESTNIAQAARQTGYKLNAALTESEGNLNLAKARELYAIGSQAIAGAMNMPATEERNRKYQEAAKTLTLATKGFQNHLQAHPSDTAVEEELLNSARAQFTAIKTRNTDSAALVRQSFSPLQQRDLIAALTNRGLAERSVGRLDEVLLQHWNAPMQQQAAPIRLDADPGRQAAITGSATNSVGQNLLLAANRNGLQLLPVPGGIEVQAAQRPLDPTAFFGLSHDDFRTAFGSTPMQAVSEDPQQTFAIDASTSSFVAARAALESRRLPDPGAIEPQHVYNAVPTDYPKPSGEEAFQLYAEAGPSPFANGPAAARTALVALGVVSRAASAAERMPLDLVVALDVSGSMGRPGGLERAQAGLAALLPQLDARDRVAVVAFGDVARVVLPAVPGNQHQRIGDAVRGLRPEGATNAADGLALAYQVAGELASPGRSCRVLLTTDGAALAGEAATTATAAVERWRGRGVSLLIVGCAGEAYDGAALERLARHGDGEHLVAASDDAARELFTGRLMPARLAVLARDAKVQMTWNPARVSHARLIGFETRRLAHEQFRDDRVDAGELAQDAQATALFEVILTEHGSGPLGTAGVRYRDTRLDRVVELNRPLPGGLVASAPSQRLHLLACAAELGEIMQAGWWRNVRCAVGSEPHDRLRAELARLDHPFARLLERMAQRHQQLERQDATP